MDRPQYRTGKWSFSLQNRISAVRIAISDLLMNNINNNNNNDKSS
jgi:hypothetical protein